MARFAAVTAVVVLALFASAAGLRAAQSAGTPPVSRKARPDFSGVWVVVSPPQGAGQEQTVKVEGDTLTTEHGSEGGGHKMTYQLDGVERRLALPSQGTDISILARAIWDGDRIVISTNTSYPNGMKTQSREIWSIDAEGRLLIDYTESGPTGPGPTMKVVHVRK
jgi:hypothetical protein